jgi:hypothetical protein
MGGTGSKALSAVNLKEPSVAAIKLIERALAGWSVENAPKEDLFHQFAPNPIPGQVMELAPQAPFAQKEEFVLGQIRPRHAEDAFRSAAATAWID